MVSKTPIVVRNQFTNVNNHSNGKTPSNFVKDYTIRKDATELIYPVSNSDYTKPLLSITESKTQTKKLDVAGSKIESDYYSTSKVQKLEDESLQMEGRCFDLNNLSLGTDTIIDSTNAIQDAFDNAHTVMLIVVSFDVDYLKERNVVSQDKEYKLNNNDEGTFKENADELKLRMSVKNGLKRLTESLGYVDPIAIGSIQLDTDNPHAHIVLAEQCDHSKSNATLFYDGTEWGTLNPKQKDLLINSIDQNLEMLSGFNPYPSNNLQNTLTDKLELQSKYSNLKLYGQISGLSILPEDSEYYNTLKSNIKVETSLSDKHVSKIKFEVKSKLKDNPIEISPYIKLQISPIANQLDSSSSLLEFSKKKRLKKVKQKNNISAIADISEKYSDLLRDPKSDPDYIFLEKTLLYKKLYENEENSKFIYKKPISEDDFNSYTSDMNLLYNLNKYSPTNEQTIVKEQLFELTINATVDRLTTADSAERFIESNFQDKLDLNRFTKVMDENDIKSAIDRLNRHESAIKTKLGIDAEELEQSEKDLLKDLESEPEVILKQSTISKDDALDIVSELHEAEKIYGPDF